MKWATAVLITALIGQGVTGWAAREASAGARAAVSRLQERVDQQDTEILALRKALAKQLQIQARSLVEGRK